MAFITSQFLKGAPERSRSFYRTQVVLKPRTRFLKEKPDNVTVVIKATRSGGDYQLVLLTAEDLRDVLPTLVESADSPTCQAIAHNILAGFDDPALVKFLAVLLSKRATA